MKNFGTFSNVGEKDGLPRKFPKLYKVKWKEIDGEFMLMFDDSVVSSWRKNIEWWYDDDGTKHIVNTFK